MRHQAKANMWTKIIFPLSQLEQHIEINMDESCSDINYIYDLAVNHDGYFKKSKNEETENNTALLLCH